MNGFGLIAHLLALQDLKLMVLWTSLFQMNIQYVSIQILFWFICFHHIWIFVCLEHETADLQQEFDLLVMKV